MPTVCLAFLLTIVQASPAEAQNCVSPISVTDTASLNWAIGCHHVNALGTNVSIDASFTLNAPTTPIDGGGGVFSALVIEGNGNNISGGQMFQIFWVKPGDTVVIKNLTMEFGQATNGGAIRNQGSLQIDDSTLFGNKASVGGAIANAGTLFINDSVISNNHANAGAADGGGINNFGALGVLDISGTTIKNNTADDEGGGIRLEANSTATITNSTIEDNEATGGAGGGILNRGDVTLETSAIFDNRTKGVAESGAAIANLDTLTVTNSTISRNVAFSLSRSGGIFTGDGATSTVTFSTVTDNAGPAGAGLEASSSATAVNVSASIVAGNKDLSNNPANDVIVTGGAANPYVSGGFNVLGTLGGNITSFGSGSNDLTGQTLADINLGNLVTANGATTRTHALLSGSVAINHVTGAIAIGTDVTEDQIGTTRPQGAAKDAGAYELPCAATSNDVDTEAKLAFAVDCFNAATTPGAWTINLTDDIEYSTELASISNATSGLSLTIDGDFANEVNANGTGIVFDIGPGTEVAINNIVAITGGNGAGIRANNATVSVKYSSVSDNTGFGIRNEFGTMQLDNVQISNNQGGLYSSDTSTSTVEDSSIFSNNVVGSGGGIHGPFADLTITDSTIFGNSATASGGGIFSQGGPLTVTGSTIASNSAGADGGGIEIRQGDATLVNTTISGNAAGGSGGGVRNELGTVDTWFSTITDNDAPDGAGIWATNDGGSTTRIEASIVSGNTGTGGDVSGFFGFTSLGHNVIGDGTAAGAFQAVGDQNGVLDPMLEVLGDFGGPTVTHALQAGSPAISAVDSIVINDQTTDQRGEARASFPKDAGAFETPSMGTCNGLEITIVWGPGAVATAGDDVILGTSGADTINGLGGNDSICGLDGNDTINGGPGDDTIFGGNENDTIFGLDGNDEIHGGAGDDELIGFNDNDAIYGGPGQDTINGGPGDDLLLGGDDDDDIFGQAGNDTIEGGSGNDFIIGVTGDDDLFGQAGNDIINGGPDNDTIEGGDDNDTIFGLTGDDDLSGDNGNDLVFGQPGIDTIDGGTGDDQLWGNEDNDTIVDPSGDNTLNGGPGDDDLTGGTGPDDIFGDGNLTQAGNDTLNGGPGQDLLIGFNGNDTITSADGEPDTVNGGPNLGDTCITDATPAIDTVFFCD